MKRLLLLFSLVFCHSAFAEVAYGTRLTQGDVSVVLTPWTNRPLVGSGIQLPPEFLKEGVMISIQTTNPATTAFFVTLNYRLGDSTATTTQLVPKGQLNWAGDIFYVGLVPVISVSVIELAPIDSTQFGE